VGKVIALVNQKGGVGKTTVTLGLASAAWAAGHRILVIDLDPQGSSTWVLGTDPNKVVMSSAELLDKQPAADAIIPSTWGDEVELIPASKRLQAREIGRPRRLRKSIAGLAAKYDAVLIDCPPSLGNLTTNGLAAADLAVIVVEPSALSLRGIGAVADLIDEVWDEHNPELELAGVIVNRVPGVSNEADRRYEELTRMVGEKALWEPVVPQRVILNEAIGERFPIHAYGSRAADVTTAFDALWARLREMSLD
jgi:chromosome partitioning protein